MKNKLLTLFLVFYAQAANASFIQYFKDEDGNTKWQYVANFSSGVLIILLSTALVVLFFVYRRVRRANRELKEIKGALEERVIERTATLDESNRLLKEEIAEHRQTTELLRFSEAYIKDILESMPLMLIGLDQEMKVTQWNQLAEDIAGVTTEEAIGRELWDAYPTITVSPQQVEEVFATGRPSTIKHSQRGQYYFDITIYPLKEQQDTGLVILIHDVTQRILAENMLIQRDKMSAMGELAATMAHDIDVPLQAILNDLRSVQDTLPEVDSDQAINPEDGFRIKSMLDDAASKGQQAVAVIGNLLAFSRSHGDEKHLADVAAILEHTIELASDVLSDPSGLRFRDVKLVRSIEENLPQLWCFASELQQVFLALFRHSCHAMGKVEKDDFVPEIQLEMIECYEAIWIKVHHNGVGMSNEEQQFIFEPFFKTTPENSLDEAVRLSFTHFIITEHHKGQIAVTSDVNVGTTFHLQLPLKDV